MSVPLIIPPTSSLISEPGAVVLDASWLYEPPPTRNAYEEFLAGPRFPNARFWDLDAVSEPHSDGYALMLPSPERFADFAGKHGVKKDSHVIVYDNEGIFAGPRTAWTFKVYGHEKLSVINGGLPRAKKEGVKLETGPPTQFEETKYPVPTLDHDAVVQFDEALKLAQRPSASTDGILLIDARPASSYQAGHIPTSLLLDFPSSLLKDPVKFTYLREPEELKKHIADQLGQDKLEEIVSSKATVVNTCGGGLSAAINWLSLQSLGVDSRLYDEVSSLVPSKW
ncbi:thiosulfate sulfurtransferase [Exophiala viscosa]|uniref:Thiosulfate sulfurtransferase n=1 Tax=Exophiala viscosa TaxID=2486360 RepID=A0AAN6IFS6_9EURO|nr:thiosulfate sulfurtransferase [Exophiala viscosa]